MILGESGSFCVFYRRTSTKNPLLWRNNQQKKYALHIKSNFFGYKLCLFHIFFQRIIINCILFTFQSLQQKLNCEKCILFVPIKEINTSLKYKKHSLNPCKPELLVEQGEELCEEQRNLNSSRSIPSMSVLNSSYLSFVRVTDSRVSIQPFEEFVIVRTWV